MFSISISISSLSKSSPTPAGVPVAMTSPFSSVIMLEMNSITFGMGNIMFLVLEFCFTSPFTRVVMLRLWGLMFVTM